MKKQIINADVLYKGRLQKVNVLFDENEILEVGNEIYDEVEVIDACGLTLLPGLVDVHVHFRQPGHEEKETIHTGSLAAAHGGFTSVFAMPNIIPSPDTKEVMEEYLELIKKESVVHTYPYGTITKNEQGKELSDLNAMNALGVHWFSDDGVGMNDQSIMKVALEKSREQNFIVACHTEDLQYRPKGGSVHLSKVNTDKGWIGIPDECESEPLKADLQTALQTHGRYHACHISSHQSVEALKEAKKNGGDVSAEVTVHHLLLEDKDVKGPMWKMNPPLRTHEDRMRLIEALEEGTLDFIANDHAPHTAENKNKPMPESAFGIVSLETAFPLLYTEFVHNQHRWTLQQLVDWMSEKPAKRFGFNNLGKIEKGYSSDLVLVELEKENMIDMNSFESKGKNTPFHGWSVYATVKETFVSGKSVWKEKQ
jgi:dihydroorotase